MAIRMVIDCEVCLDDGKTTPAEPVYLKVDDRGAIVDLCKPHRESIVDLVERLIADHGRPQDDGKRTPKKAPAAVEVPAPRTAAEWPCPGPGCVNRPPFISSYHLQAHVKAAHGGLSMPEVNAAIKRCRVRGCDFNGTGTSASMGIHVGAIHGYANLAVMLHDLALSDPESVDDLLAMFWNIPVPATASGLFQDPGEGLWK